MYRYIKIIKNLLKINGKLCKPDTDNQLFCMT